MRIYIKLTLRNLEIFSNQRKAWPFAFCTKYFFFFSFGFLSPGFSEIQSCVVFRDRLEKHHDSFCKSYFFIFFFNTNLRCPQRVVIIVAIKN